MEEDDDWLYERHDAATIVYESDKYTGVLDAQGKRIYRTRQIGFLGIERYYVCDDEYEEEE